MKKLQSIIFIIACFLLMTAFVTVKGRAETNPVKTDEIITVVNNAQEENNKKEEKKNTANLYNGYRGRYEFKNSKICEGDNGNKIIILNINYTNTTTEMTLPLFSFYLDTAISQDINGTVEPIKTIEKSDSVFSKNLQKNNNKVKPGETVSLIVPIELQANQGKLYIKDLITNGDNFTKIIEL